MLKINILCSNSKDYVQILIDNEDLTIIQENNWRFNSAKSKQRVFCNKENIKTYLGYKILNVKQENKKNLYFKNKNFLDYRKENLFISGCHNLTKKYDNYVEIDISSVKFPNATTKISIIDYHEVMKYKWTVKAKINNLYVNCNNGKNIYLHTFILGKLDNRVIDHINGDTLDNRRQNLRHITHQQNLWNVHTPVKSETGERNISKQGNLYRVTLSTDCKRHIGYFKTIKEAIIARDKAYIKYKIFT